MKIGLASDVHLEFGPLVLENPGDVDVLILNGDICTAKDLDWSAANMYGDTRLGRTAEQYHEFFSAASHNFKHVIYIAGNHEHYNYDFKLTVPHIKHQLQGHKNLHFLDNEIKIIDDVVFVGGTMWSNMNDEDPLTMLNMSRMMNDFRCIANSNNILSQKVPTYQRNDDDTLFRDENGLPVQTGYHRKESPSTFSPTDAVEEYKKFCKFLEYNVNYYADKKIVVCTHHTPSKQSCHPRYKTDFIMNGGYHTEKTDYILDSPQIKLWTHGHTHEDYDYMIGSTRIACNPRGYINHEERADHWKLKVMEI